MTTPKVLNMRHGVQPGPGKVRIDRATKWGNPFVLGRDGTRDEVCDKYAAWFEKQPHLIAALPEIAASEAVLCWCAPLRCHGDFLVRRATSGAR